MLVFLSVNIWEKKNGANSETVTLNAYSMKHVKDGTVVTEDPTYILCGLAVVVFALSVFSLFSFKKRMLQLQIGLGLSLGIAALLGSIIYYSFQGEKLLGSDVKGSFGPGLLVPAISLILNSLANRFIKRDEEMVRSSDRMR